MSRFTWCMVWCTVNTSHWCVHPMIQRRWNLNECNIYEKSEGGGSRVCLHARIYMAHPWSQARPCKCTSRICMQAHQSPHLPQHLEYAPRPSMICSTKLSSTVKCSFYRLLDWSNKRLDSVVTEQEDCVHYNSNELRRKQTGMSKQAGSPDRTKERGLFPMLESQ